jgi:CO/xanthine dehydrogenase Mo-binding subunit
MAATQAMKEAHSMADLAGINGTRKEFKVVGKPNLPGKLSYSIATGMAKFGADYVFPDMLHARFLRSPYANAAVRSVDVAVAKKIPGVVDFVTREDVHQRPALPVQLGFADYGHTPDCR